MKINLPHSVKAVRLYNRLLLI